MANGILDCSSEWCRIFSLFLKGYPEITLTNGINKSVINDGTIPLLKSINYNFDGVFLLIW